MCRYRTADREMAAIVMTGNGKSYSEAVSGMLGAKKVSAFLDRKSEDITGILQSQFSSIFDARFKVGCRNGRAGWWFEMESFTRLTTGAAKTVELIVEEFQKGMAKEFNESAISSNEYGTVNFPPYERFGCSLSPVYTQLA